MGNTELATEGPRLAPAEAFAIVGNETRLEILHVLFEEKFRAMPFAELRKRVGMRDGSQFNYHLKKLDGPFVRKTDDGYELRHAGINVVRSIVEGSFTDHPCIPPFETGGACVACGEPLHAEYEHEMVFVRCSACRTMHAMGMFPPGALAGRTGHEVLAAFERWMRCAFHLSVDGICSTCRGRTTGTLVRDPEDVQIKVPVDPTDFPSFDLGIKYQCERCDVWDFGSAGEHILDHPAVVGFHRDHGVDPNTVPYWELDWVVTNERTTVVAEDPLRVQVTVPLDTEELRVTLDETFAVRDVERAPATSWFGETRDHP